MKHTEENKKDKASAIKILISERTKVLKRKIEAEKYMYNMAKKIKWKPEVDTTKQDQTLINKKKLINGLRQELYLLTSEIEVIIK